MSENQSQPQQPQVIYVEHPPRKKNGLGTAGFVLAIVSSLVLFWVPGLNWFMWLLGLIFSFIGVFRTPRGLAIAGLCISLLGLILIGVFARVVLAAFVA